MADDKITGRILDATSQLAEEGGFEAVRIRDVAARADVALGTIYKRFQGKDEILLALLHREVDRLESVLAWLQVRGDTYLERVRRFFEPITYAMCGRDNFARAVIRAIVSGEPGLIESIAGYHQQTTRLIGRALTSDGIPGAEARSLTEDELEGVAYTLAQIWFAALVGWMSGLFGPDHIVETVADAAQWLIRGRLSAG